MSQGVTCVKCKEYIEYCRCGSQRPEVKLNAQGVTMQWIEKRLDKMEKKVDEAIKLLEGLKESNKTEL